MPNLQEAVVLCTRNRPAELTQTLRSVAEQDGAADRLVLVVDASDAEKGPQVDQSVSSLRTQGLPVQSHRYTGTPSLARQRNEGVDQLPDAVEVVHFIDDDVTLENGYFSTLTGVLASRPEVGGVGGVIHERSAPSFPPPLSKRAFLLGDTTPGRVLLSGCAAPAQRPACLSNDTLLPTEWLSGCSSSYRRRLLEEHRFDEALTGYSMLEDLDLSYRVGQSNPLVVAPSAQLLHRRAAQNRPNPEQYHYALTVHRRWFVEKHFGSRRARLAYAWSLVGRLLALCTSAAPARAALRGLLRGVATVCTRQHPLLCAPAPNG